MIIPFKQFFNEIFKENMTVGDVFGNTSQSTGSASQTTYNYAEDDTRIPKVLGSKSKNTAPPPIKGSTYVEQFLFIKGIISDNNCLFPPTHFRIGVIITFFAMKNLLPNSYRHYTISIYFFKNERSFFFVCSQV